MTTRIQLPHREKQHQAWCRAEHDPDTTWCSDVYTAQLELLALAGRLLEDNQWTDTGSHDSEIDRCRECYQISWRGHLSTCDIAQFLLGVGRSVRVRGGYADAFERVSWYRSRV